eukprot:71561-Rhodomonas_salina.3
MATQKARARENVRNGITEEGRSRSLRRERECQRRKRGYRTKGLKRSQKREQDNRREREKRGGRAHACPSPSAPRLRGAGFRRSPPPAHHAPHRSQHPAQHSNQSNSTSHHYMYLCYMYLYYMYLCVCERARNDTNSDSDIDTLRLWERHGKRDRGSDTDPQRRPGRVSLWRASPLSCADSD